MSLETGLIGFAALTSLALATPRHRARLAAIGPAPPVVARVAGWILMALSTVAAIAALGPAFGLVAWIGQLSIAGALLVLLLSWRPAYAAPFAAGALGLALLLVI